MVKVLLLSLVMALHHSNRWCRRVPERFLRRFLVRYLKLIVQLIQLNKQVIVLGYFICSGRHGDHVEYFQMDVLQRSFVTYMAISTCLMPFLTYRICKMLGDATF